MAQPPLSLGFIVDGLSEAYQQQVFLGFNTEAMRLNLNVFCFVGGRLDRQRGPVSPEPARREVYGGLGGHRFEGVMVLTGTLGDNIDPSQHRALLANYAAHACCTVGLAVDGFPSITLDNAAGMREAMMHLVGDRNRRRIAYIGGPEGNKEAQERYRVYREVLAESNIPFEPELVVTGDFGAASGIAAAHTLLTERHVAFDALMAASDLMAVGALNVLLERGVSVPEKVCICGFDDIEPARFAARPLTTVHQPLSDLGRSAVEQLLHRIYGNPSTDHQVLPARLVKRCSTERLSPSLPPTRAGGTGPSVQAVFASLVKPLEEVFRQQSGPGCADDSAVLVRAFFRELSSGRQGIIQRTSFLMQLEQYVVAMLTQSGDAATIYGLLDTLEESVRGALEAITSDGEPLTSGVSSSRTDAGRSLSAAQVLLSRARERVGVAAERFHVQYRLQLREWQDTIHIIGERLLHARDAVELARVFTKEVPALGIPAGIVCTFERDNTVRAHMAFDGFGSVDCPPTPYPASELFPAGVFADDRRRTWITTDLYGSHGTSGYVTLEMGPVDAEIYRLLAHYLSGALRGLETLAPLPPLPHDDDDDDDDFESDFGVQRL